METQTIDKLFLELSQITKAKTAKELAMEGALNIAMETLIKLSLIGHRNDYDWNADPNSLTLLETDTINVIKRALGHGIKEIRKDC